MAEAVDMSLRFDFEWEDPGRARGDELRATWARLQIIVDNKVVTRLIDKASRAERGAIYGSLFPIAEWFTQNWFFIFSEVGSSHTRDRSYLPRHSLRHAGEGLALPDIRLLPAGEVMEVLWRRSRPEHHAIEFIDSGEALLPIIEVKAEITRFLQAVVDRLEFEEVSAPSLVEEWNAIQSLSSEESDFATAAASLGIDPFDASKQEEGLVLSAASKLPGEVLPEFLAITKPNEILRQIEWFEGALDLLAEHESPFTDLVELSERVLKLPYFIDRPFERGYEYARFIRNELGINGHPVTGLAGLAGLFGSFAGGKESGILLRPDLHQRVHALALADGAPKFLLTKEREDSRRFAFSRGIFSYLAQAFCKVDIVADSYFAKDKAGRAFAAELLAPSEGLKKRVDSPIVDSEEVLDLAEEFDVSTQVIENQLRNHHIAEIAPMIGRR